MNCQYVKNKLQDIDKALNQVKTSRADPALSFMLASYLVVFISGTYEDCIEQLFIERASKSQDRELQHFVEMVIKSRFRNPNYETIKGWINYLDNSYGKRLDKSVRSDGEAINSIVTNKNRVAHGSCSNATLQDLIGWHQKAKRIFQALDRMLI